LRRRYGNRDQTANFTLPKLRRLLNGITIALGMNEIFGLDPPFVAAAVENR
jgi:hypothetical protein